MINVRLICMGKLRDRHFADGVNEYAKRLSSYCKFEIIEINEERLSSDNAQRAEIESVLSKEGAAILRKIPEKSKIVCLCVEGKGMTTEEFADFIDSSATAGTSSFTFVIGSSYGLSEDVKSKADLKLSFSKMTFPHTLMRVILCEQIYRAFKVIKGETYHK